MRKFPFPRTAAPYSSTLLLGSIFLLIACGGGDNPASRAAESVTEALCRDGLDNDQDGKADCDDLDCQAPGGDCRPAPALDRTVASTLGETAAFLYTGENPLQKGADPKAFDPKRVAMLHGRIVGASGAPLAGVRVEVQNHKEYGYTFARADGAYDLAVNGGSRLLLEYSMDGHLPAQRTAQPGWQRHVTVADVGLVAAEGKTTTFAVGAADSQTITGNEVVDASGRHEPFIVFEPGTVAHAVLPDGSKEALSTLSVTVTEYPISSTNRYLPGTPPATSGVSYALEFDVAEAKARDALHVEFSEPVSLYVENFIGLPTGSALPLSIYDCAVGQWERGTTGRVVEVVGVADGVAAVDSDGDDIADDAATLDALGITSSDLNRLGARYAPGAQLWHAKVPHFSTSSLNGWVGAPKGAVAPSPAGLRKSTPDNPSRVGPLLIEPRAIQHGIPITGTPYSLQYQSMRAKGYGDAYQLALPLTSATLPPGLKRVDYRVTVAGRLFEGSVLPEVNKTQAVQWDGRDNHGRLLQSPQRAEVYIGYVYDGVAANGAPLSPSKEVVLGDTFYVTMGLWDAKSCNLGGFGLDVLHAYDPATRTIYFGYGDQRSAESIALVTKPTSVDPSFILGTPDGVFVAADGGLLVTDDQQQDANALGKILRITREGKPSVVAGPGASGAAASIQLAQPQGIVALDDGSMIVSDYLKKAIRSIDPNGRMTTLVSGNASDAPKVLYPLSSADGIVMGPRQELYIVDADRVLVLEAGKLVTFAGGGTETTDGGRATSALLAEPSGVAVTRDGLVYLSERAGNRIRKVLIDGTIQTVAGTGVAGFAGDGKQAITAQLNGPRGLALGPDGSVYVADQGNDRIRRITPDGLILTVMGGGKTPPAEGNLAINVTLDRPDGMAVAPDGTLYVTSSNNVFKVVSGQEHVGDQDNLIPSSDGLTLYRFDYRGKHLSTIDAMTGVAELSFGYDASGLLATIKDKDGLVTTLNRGAAGNPASIVGPYAQVTALELLAGGDVARVTDPIARTWQLTWDGTTGLLSGVIDPTQKATTFAYDPVGRLTDVRDPTDQADPSGAASHHLESTVAADGFMIVSDKVKTGQVTEYWTRNTTGEVWERAVRRADGTTDSSAETSETLVSLDSDGTKVTEFRVIDVILKSQSMVPYSIDIELPSGRKLEVAPIMRWKTVSDVTNILAMETWRDEVTINGRSFETAYSRSTNTVTTTTPMGRKATTTLDVLGRPISMVAAGQPTMNWTYDEDGRAATITKTAGNETRSEVRGYGAGGWISSRINSIGEQIGYLWDLVGRPDRITRPDGNQTKWVFDTADNVTELTPPGSVANAFRYDPSTKLLTVSSPPAVAQPAPMLLAGQQSYEYGPRHELTAITHSDGRSISFAYTDVGRLKSQSLSTATLSFEYDKGGALTSVNRSDGVNVAMTHDGPLWTGTTWSGAISGSVKADYDNDFWLKSLTVNDASTVNFSYDKDGLIIGADSGPNAAMTVTRDPNTGMVAGTSLGNVVTTKAYNAFGELSSLTTTVAGNVLFTQSIERDRLGRVSHIAEMVQGISHALQYTYDNLGRLSSATRDGVTTTYGYDLNGNRTSVTVNGVAETAGYDPQDRILTMGSVRFEMTPHGDLLREVDGAAVTELAYDELGNLRKQRANDGVAATSIDYVVDGFGRRVARKYDGAFDKSWLYRDGLRPISEVDSQGTFKRFVYAESQDGAPDFLIQDGRPCRFVKDHLGSVRLLVDAQTGAVIQALEYDAYGVVLSDTDPGFQPFGFAGGLYDADTKLVRFGARDYDPETGRWTNKDPIGFAGGDTNVYAYVGGDPVNRVDPTGANAIVLSALGGGGAASGGWFAAVADACPLAAAFVAGFAVGDAIAPYVMDPIVDAIPTDWFYKEHTSNARPSSKPKHQKGETRKMRDGGGEKGDGNRGPTRKRPKGKPGPWPPRYGVLFSSVDDPSSETAWGSYSGFFDETSETCH